jgi:hypothetical protein
MKNLDLRHAAQTIDLPPGDLDTVTARGVTLARRRHRVLAGGLTISVLAASAGLYTRLNQPRPVPVAAGNATAKRGDVAIRWEKVDSKSGLAFTTTLAQDTLYAVSTAPGRSAPDDRRRFVWQSTDGIDWSAVTELKGDLYVANLADSGTRLYGVGTGPATAVVAGRKPVAPLVIGASEDGGRNWARQTLPIDVSAISAKSRSVDVRAVDVATTQDAVVAIASLASDLDVPSVLPAGKTAPNGWAITESGVDVLGNGPECPPGTSTSPPNVPDKRAMARAAQGDTGPTREYPHECFTATGSPSTVTPQQSRGVADSFTWDQLHVDGDLLRAVRAEPIVFRSDAGGLNFQRVESAEVAKLDGPGMLDRDGDGLLLVGQAGAFPDGMKANGPDTVILRSLDGRTWTTSPPPPGLSYAAAIGRLGDRTSIMGESTSGPTLWVSDGTGGWSATSLASAVDPSVRDKANVSLVSAGVGRLGAVAVVAVMRDPVAERGGIDLSSKGYTLHVVNDRWAATLTDPTGKEVARSDNVMDSRSTGALRGGGSDGSVTFVDPQTNAVIVRFAADAVNNAFKSAMSESRVPPTYRLVASRDGLTWSDQDVSELAGQPIVNVVRVLMTGEKAVVAVEPPAPGKDQPSKQIALVGTPR